MVQVKVLCTQVGVSWVREARRGAYAPEPSGL